VHARECWISYYNEIAAELGEHGKWGDLTDIAAKSAEQAARLAGVWHIFEGGEAPGEISDTIMVQAVRLARWCLAETRRALGLGEVSPVYADARALIDWACHRKVASFPAREVLRTGPTGLRDPERRDAALDLLVETGHLRLVPRSSDRGITYHLNPKAGERSRNH
jgi:hypothetical protein